MQQKLLLVEGIENCLQMVQVFLQGGVVDEYIVEEDCNKAVEEGFE